MTDLTFEGFDDLTFTAEEMTSSMNVVPNMYDLITRLGIFANPIPISTTFVSLEINNGVLNLLPTTERGGPASKGSMGKRSRKTFEVPNIAHEDAIMAAEIQNLRAFGSMAPQMFGNRVNDKLATMAMKHYLTHEYFRVGALSGKILDADGTELIDLFDEFDVTEKVEYFGATGSVNQHIRDVKRHIELNLMGETMTGVAALCSSGFFDMLIEDDDVKAAYNAAAAAQAANPNLMDVRAQFVHQGVLWIEYLGRASVLNADGTTSVRKFIADNTCRFVPIGTMDSAKFYTAPADFIETANQPGQLFYAKPETMKYGRGLEIHTQSNPLPLWTRPALLVQGTTAAS